MVMHMMHVRYVRVRVPQPNMLMEKGVGITERICHANFAAEVTQSAAQVVIIGDRLRLQQLAMGQ